MVKGQHRTIKYITNLARGGKNRDSILSSNDSTLQATEWKRRVKTSAKADTAEFRDVTLNTENTSKKGQKDQFHTHEVTTKILPGDQFNKNTTSTLCKLVQGGPIFEVKEHECNEKEVILPSQLRSAPPKLTLIRS